MLEIYEKFDASREILVAIKGDDFQKIKELEKRVLANDSIVLKKSFFQNKEFREYIKQYRFYLQEYNEEKLSSIGLSLQKAYENLRANPYYTTIDKIDPLGLFEKKKLYASIKIKNGHMYLDDYGYMSIFSFQEESNPQEVYAVFSKEIKEDVKVFSPAFYYVENEQAVKAEVNLLVFLALSILLLLYLGILKNIFLLTNTVLTLLNSSMLSLLLVTFIWDEVSIFVMVFGISISTIAIDYMFHHYFSGFYSAKKGFNRAVFFGFLSTFFAFVVLSFIDFPFIRQVSFYASISLLFSYLVFAFIFPVIGFRLKSINIFLPSLNIVKNYKILVFAFTVLIGISLINITIDLDIKNLGYQNSKLKAAENFFKNRLNTQGKTPFIIKAKSMESLISKSHKIQSLHKNAVLPLANLLTLEEFKQRKKVFLSTDFSSIRQKIHEEANGIGFRENFFQEAYPVKLLYPNPPAYSIGQLQEYGFDVYFDGKEYYGFGFLEKSTKAEGVHVLDSTKLFANSLKRVYKQFLYSGGLILLVIVFILYLSTKENFFKALSYILVPLGVVVSFVGFHEINALQIFMLFILLALSIDYGIYMSSKELLQTSQKAVLFSLLSTFAGFGILVFSSIGVLFFIGEVATIGLLAIFILMLIGRK